LLREVCDVLRIPADEKHISVTLDTGTVDTVLGDPARLRQVVYNYLSNAIKFAPNGGAVQVRACWDGERAYRIEVEDNGPGIPEAAIPRLFTDFQQLNHSHASIGTGLGLALTKRIVETQGGTVGVRVSPGKGTVFFAVLPIEAADNTSASNQPLGDHASA